METVCNRTPLPDRTVAAGEILEGVQLCPVGEWRNGEKPQHCTAEALENLVNRWKADGSPEILVDFEHQAEAGGTSDTSAAAWADNLRVEPGKGLVADFRLTDLGAEAISNRRLRFLSVAWGLNRKTREPMGLYSIALTNKPNIPVEPILNRVPGHLPEKFLLPLDLEKQPNNNKEPNMDQLKELLGLAPEATEEDVSSAVKTLKTRLDELEHAAAEAEAETFAETNKAKADKAVLKAQFLANKEVARAIVEAIPEPKAPEKPAETQQILNKAAAKTPEPQDVVKELNKLPAGEARVRFVCAHAAELAEAAQRQ